MIQIRDLSVAKKDKPICRIAELDVTSGERIAIVGANGSGKSTLLRVLGGLETDFSGLCNVDAAMNERCYVHQTPYLFRGTVLTNVSYGLRSAGYSKRESARLSTEMLNDFGLMELVNQSSQYLSGGERRRVAIARALVLKPKLLLLDEPFSDLDSDGSCAVQTILDRLRGDSGCTTLISSPVEASHLQAARIVKMGFV